MKRKIFLAMTTALSALFLASCSCNACSGNTKVSFKDYFLRDVKDNPATVSETLVYSVSHTGSNTYNNYTVNYSNGTYTTNLQKTGQTQINETDVAIYTLTTSFTIDVSYTYNGVSLEVPFTDTITSTTTFYSGTYMLKPISSEKTIYSHSPAQSQPDSLEKCYMEYNQTVKTDYSNNSSTIINHKDGSTKTNTFEIEDTDKYAYLDNEQLLFALRCMTPSNTAKMQVYSPFANSVQQIATTFGSAASQNFELSIAGKEGNSFNISYYPVSLEIDAKHNGTTQTAWIAETKDASNNEYRNVMLKYIAPLPFTLGELHYNLISATFA